MHLCFHTAARNSSTRSFIIRKTGPLLLAMFSCFLGFVFLGFELEEGVNGSKRES